MTPPRSPAPAVMAAVALVVMVLGVWPNWWFSGEMHDNDDDTDSYMSSSELKLSMDFGLREISACFEGNCSSTGYSSMSRLLGEADNEEAKDFKRFIWAGGATFWSGMVCAGAMAVSLVLFGMRQRLPFSVPTVAGSLGAVTAALGTIAFLLKPKVFGSEMMMIDIHVSVGYPLCLLGGVGCAIAGFMLAKDEKGYVAFGSAPAYGGMPYQAGPMTGYGQPLYPPPPPPLQAQISPACPRCMAPAVFVAEYQRYFCSSCRAYL